MQRSGQGQSTRGICTFVPQQQNYGNNQPQPFMHPALHPQHRQDVQRFQAPRLPQDSQGPIPLRMPQMHPTVQLTTSQHARRFSPSLDAQHPYPSQSYYPSLASQQPYHTQTFNPLDDPSRIPQIPNGSRSRSIPQTPVAYTTENIFLTVPPQFQHHRRAPYPTPRLTPPSTGQALKFADRYGSAPSQASMPKSTRDLQLAYKQMRAAIGMQMHRAKVDAILAQERGSVKTGWKKSTTRTAATQRPQRYPGAPSGLSNTVQQPMEVIDLTTGSPPQSLACLSSEWPSNDFSMYAPPVSQPRASLPHARAPATAFPSQVSQFIMAEPMPMGSMLIGKSPALFSATDNDSTSAAIDQPFAPMVGELSSNLPAKESQPSQSVDATNADSRTSLEDDAPATGDDEWADHGLFTYDDCIASMARKADLTDKYHVAFEGTLPDDEKTSDAILTIFSAIGCL